MGVREMTLAISSTDYLDFLQQETRYYRNLNRRVSARLVGNFLANRGIKISAKYQKELREEIEFALDCAIKQVAYEFAIGKRFEGRHEPNG